jgi:hypothetical protein
MIYCFAGHITSERASAEIAQPLDEPFNGYRTEEAEDIERVLVLEAAFVSFSTPIGDLVQLGDEQRTRPSNANFEHARIARIECFQANSRAIDQCPFEPAHSQARAVAVVTESRGAPTATSHRPRHE